MVLDYPERLAYRLYRLGLFAHSGVTGALLLLHGQKRVGVAGRGIGREQVLTGHGAHKQVPEADAERPRLRESNAHVSTLEHETIYGSAAKLVVATLKLRELRHIAQSFLGLGKLSNEAS